MALCFLANISKKVYVVDCPYCNAKTDVPVDEQGAECSRCGKRVIVVDGVVKRAE